MNITFPFDTSLLLRKKKLLRREWSQKNGLLEKRIAILGGSTTEEVADMLELCLLARGIKPVFYQGAYGQFLQEALQPSQALRDFKPELVYIHTSAVNIQTFPGMSDTADVVENLLQQQLQLFSSAWNGIRQHLGCTIIQNNFEEPWHRPMGNLDGSDYRGKSRFVSRLNDALADAAQQRQELLIHDIHYLSARIGLDHWFNPRQWYLYKYAMGMEAIVQLVWQLSAVIAGVFGLSHKCLVLDLDNTLWGGVIGDDGVDGIAIGSHSAEAEAHSELQRYALALKQRGVLLAICSKNDEANARAGFTHPDSVLQPSDFSAFLANWQHKPYNLADIANHLNIGIDSLVFLDDNPAERELVQQQLPRVAVPDVGSDISDFIRILDQAALFESVSISVDDMMRSAQYRDNRTRESQQTSFASYDEFLQSLDMRATIEPFCERNLERITQLTNKTNQFNLTTRRCSVTDIQQMQNSDSFITLSGRLTDKFGDNGLVSVVAGKIEQQALHIELWLMSCRVLKRGLEFAMLAELCRLARLKGVTSVIGYYLPTEKNSMVATLFSNMGFRCIEQTAAQSVWQLELASHTITPSHFIAINSGKNP